LVLVADQQIMFGLLLLELQMRRAGADQNHRGAKRLTDGLSEIVLDIGAGFAARHRKAPPAARNATRSSNTGRHSPTLVGPEPRKSLCLFRSFSAKRRYCVTV
jgi:hypothetical protein